MKKYRFKLGVHGGMGPAATASFYMRIVERAQRVKGARFNSDFPPMVINSHPVPDGQMWRGYDDAQIRGALAENTRLLETAGCDFVAVPCCSVHAFVDVMREAVRIPVLSIIEETMEEARGRGLRTIAVLGTHFTIGRRTFHDVAEKRGMRVVVPRETEQNEVDAAALRVQSGQRSEADRTALCAIVDRLAEEEGAEGVILGCTEIPLLLSQKDVSVTVLDALEVLAESSWRIITGERPLPASPSRGHPSRSYTQTV
jgi:aspartate racemase